MKLYRAYWIIFSVFWLLRAILQWNLLLMVGHGVLLCFNVYVLIVPPKKDENKKTRKLYPKLYIALIILHLAFFPIAFRVISVENRPVLLLAQHRYSDIIFENTDTGIRAAFEEAGKSPDRLTIRAVGSNSTGRYLRCEYEEPDGSVSKYYAFEYKDHNRTSVTVFWE